MTGTAGWIVAAGMALTVAAGLAMLRRRWHLINVRGVSMMPTLHDGDRLIVNSRARPRTGRIVVFVAPRRSDDIEWMIKRVVAMAGDWVPLDMRAVISDEVVPPGCLVVRGDNPASQDSRHFGYVRVGSLLGSAVRRSKTRC